MRGQSPTHGQAEAARCVYLSRLTSNLMQPKALCFHSTVQIQYHMKLDIFFVFVLLFPASATLIQRSCQSLEDS